MSTLFILSCKEVNGNVYVTRLPKAIDGQTPGVPDNWYFVGPGSRPSVQEYNGTKFILTFDYLSHLFCRIFDISTWPPTQVNPVQISGGPNPPSAITYNIQLTQDSLSLKTTPSNTSFGIVAPYFNPPLLQVPTLFEDPLTTTYSVTIQPISNWFPQPPAGATVFYRLYVRPFPFTGAWVLHTDWTVTAGSQPLFSFPFSSVGSLRYQFSVTWGDMFDPMQPWNPAAHAEGIPGATFVTVDSAVTNPSFQFLIDESLTLSFNSSVSCPNFGERESFVDESPDDQIQLSVSLLGHGSNSFGFFGTRQAFVNEAGADSINGGYFPSNPAAYVGGNALKAVMG